MPRNTAYRMTGRDRLALRICTTPILESSQVRSQGAYARGPFHVPLMSQSISRYPTSIPQPALKTRHYRRHALYTSPMLNRSTSLASNNIRAPPPGTKHDLKPTPRRRNKRARLIIIRIAISIRTHPLRGFRIITRTAAVRPVVLARAAVTRVPVFAAGRYAGVEGWARNAAVGVGVHAIAGR